MKIVQLYKGRVPTFAYGGLERMVFWLSRELFKQGHEVVLVAEEAGPEINQLGINFIKWPKNLNVLKSLLPNVDIMHFHQPFPAEYKPPYPYIITEHGNHRRKQAVLPNTVFLSRSHAENHKADHFISNGIPLDEYQYTEEKDNDLLYMAKLGWSKKNAKTAINLALDTNTPVSLCGGDLWNEPKIRGLWMWRARREKNKQLLRSCGNVGGVEKLRLLQHSGLLFYIVNWQEPFALAPHEAMAAGTPVICSPNGALTEYIQHGKNGYIVSTYREACDAIKFHKQLVIEDKLKMYKKCRETAFNIVDSVQAYLNAYETIVGNDFLYPPEDAKKFRYAPGRTAVVKKFLA